MSGAILLRSLLQTVGCDGLANPDLDCGCSIDDLMPCASSDLRGCYPARAHRTPEGPGFHTCAPRGELVAMPPYLQTSQNMSKHVQTSRQEEP